MSFSSWTPKKPLEARKCASAPSRLRGLAISLAWCSIAPSQYSTAAVGASSRICPQVLRIWGAATHACSDPERYRSTALSRSLTRPSNASLYTISITAHLGVGDQQSKHAYRLWQREIGRALQTLTAPACHTDFFDGFAFGRWDLSFPRSRL